MISLNRAQIRRMIISEIKRFNLPDYMYKDLEKSISESLFWTYDNSSDGIGYNTIFGEEWEQTEAAEVLGDAIQSFFDFHNFSIIIVVRSPDPEYNPDYVIGKGSRLYPNSLVFGGEQGLTKRGRFIMYLNLAIFSDTFDISDVDSNLLSGNIGRIIRHEIIHTDHYEKRSKKQKISRIDAKQRFEDEGEIVDSISNREGYFKSKIEIDAYAHQFAEELLVKYGKDQSLAFLRGPDTIFYDLDISIELIDFLFNFKNTDIIKRLKSKIYKNIIELSDREIYESKKRKKKNKRSNSGSQPEDTYMKGTKKNLYLDKPSSHGGWPSGPSKSFTSNKPVMKQISSWLENMKMLEELEEEFEDI